MSLRGRPRDTGSEREGGHAPPWQGLDRVAGRRERVGVLAIAKRPQHVGPRPAGRQRRQAGGFELEPGLVAGADDAEPVDVGLEQAGNVSMLVLIRRTQQPPVSSPVRSRVVSRGSPAG